VAGRLDEIMGLLRGVLARLDALTQSKPPAAGVSAEPKPRDGPVTSWAAVARAVGLSEDTIGRRREEWGIEEEKPHFDNSDEARRWFRKCEHRGAGMEPRTPAPRAPRTPRPSARGTKGTTLADLLAARERGR
jgi:hypothetical protein